MLTAMVMLVLLALLSLLLLAAALTAGYRFVVNDGGPPRTPPRPNGEEWHPRLRSRSYAED